MQTLPGEVQNLVDLGGRLTSGARPRHRERHLDAQRRHHGVPGRVGADPVEVVPEPGHAVDRRGDRRLAVRDLGPLNTDRSQQLRLAAGTGGGPGR
jgi:hypothetical protein